MQRHTKALVSVLSGFAMLFLLVQPSGASAGTVNSGHLGVNMTPALTTDLTPNTGPCPNVAALALDATSTAPTSVHVTLHITNGGFAYSGATYFLNGITSHATGTINHTTTAFTVGPFSSTVGNLYPETFPGSCVPNTNAPLCGGVRLNTTTAPLNLHGTFPAGHSFSPPNLTGTAVVSGSGGIQAAGCVAPFSALNGKTLTFTNMNVTFV